MVSSMFCAARKLIPFLFIPLLTQCVHKSAPSTNSVTGPFDSSGNYIEDWVDRPDKWHRPSDSGSKPKRKQIAKREQKQQAPEIALVEPRPVQVVVKPTAKPIPKPKPKFVFHKVSRGDTLSGLSRRYGTSISRIKSANGISGTIIRLGQTLKIPK